MGIKKFSTSPAILEGIEHTIRAAQDYSGELRHEVVRIDKLELDHENPRDLKLTLVDIKNGVKEEDPDYARKKKEIEDLSSLSKSISSDGLINPIMVYQHGDKFKVLAGERRTLASALAGKDMIYARIMDRKPDLTKIAILQWAENVERKDLSLMERRDNLLKLNTALAKERGTVFEPKTIMELLGCSKAIAYRYYALMQADEELVEGIKAGVIQNLRDLERLTAEKDLKQRKDLLETLKKGLKVSTLFKPSADEKKSVAIKPGRQPKKVHFGSTMNLKLAQEILTILLSDARFKDLKKEISSSDGSVEFLNKAFEKIIKKLEGQVR